MKTKSRPAGAGHYANWPTLLLAAGIAALMMVTGGVVGAVLSPTATPFHGSSATVPTPRSESPVAGLSASEIHPLVSVPTVSETLVLPNDTLQPGNFLAGNGFAPVGVSYDTVLKQIFVADSGANNVTVISGTIDTVVANISVWNGSVAVAYDNGKKETFVANENGTALTGNVSVIADVNDTVLKNVTVGTSPVALAYVPTRSEIFVANSGSNNVSILRDGNNSTVLVNLTVGSKPVVLVYDAGKHLVWVADEGSDNILGISVTTDKVVASVPVGVQPVALAYDSKKKEVFVANYFSGNVSIVSDASDKVIASVPVGTGPDALAYDPTNKEVVVANSFTDNVSIISDLYNTVVAHASVGGDPAGIAFDTATDRLYVANSATDNVSVLAGLTSTVVGTVAIAATPDAVAFDSGTDEQFVANTLSNTVDIVSGTSNSILATVRVGTDPTSLAYDSGQGRMFVANHGSNNVSIISDSTDKVVQSIPVGFGPAGLTYDPVRDEILVANSESNNVSVINLTSDTVGASVPVGVDPDAIVFDSGVNETFVANSASNNLSVILDVVDVVVANIHTGISPAALAYDSGRGEIFVANSGSNNVSVISDLTDKVLTSVNVGADPVALTYQGRLASDLLVANFEDNTTSVIADATNTVAATLPVGNNPAAADYDSTHSVAYVADMATGTVSILRTAQTLSVTFKQTGLPGNTTWTVALDGLPVVSNLSAVPFFVSNGSYSYLLVGPSGQRISGTPPAGTVNVSGTSVVVSFSFLTAKTYTLTIKEAQLPTGATWCVALQSWERCTTATKIAVLNLTPGAYAYTIGAHGSRLITAKLGGKTIPLSGSLVLGTKSLAMALTYAWTYAVIFTETGLPGGTNWSVTVSGVLEYSTSTSIVFHLGNGSYPVVVGKIVNYTSPGAPHHVAVKGAALVEPVTFTAKTMGVPLANALGAASVARAWASPRSSSPAAGLGTA